MESASLETWRSGGGYSNQAFHAEECAFVPLNFVLVLCNGLKAEMPDNERYAAYFDETWFDGHFRPHMWNYYRHCGPRTTNHLEGWHNRMKRISQKAHPNLYKVLELFQREQAASEVIILQPEAGETCRQKGRKRVEREQKIQTLADELANGDRDIDSYISAIRHCAVSFDFS